MENRVHGGDIYRNRVKIDFSVNTNPFGIPELVKAALLEAVSGCDRYPDIDAEELCSAIAEIRQLPKSGLVCGNGASELFLAAVHALKPEKVLLPVPSFWGYERAARAADSEIVYFDLKEENGFAVDETILAQLTEEIDLLFLANPNNPVGNVIEPELLDQIADRCLAKHIRIIMDECFIDFTGNGKRYSMQNKLETYPNVLLIQAFTKLYAIPGVRLGYLACSDKEIIGKIRAQLPEWNVSVFAQKAGIAALRETEFAEKSVAFVRKEREWIARELEKCGCKVFLSQSNFLLIWSRLPLYEKLLEKGILIRDCCNFKGLTSGYYRIAVKCREENVLLLRAIGEILEDRPIKVQLRGLPEDEKIHSSADQISVSSKQVEFVLPNEIENRSFEMIAKELKERQLVLHPSEETVIKRVIHTSADFSYAQTMTFSPNAVEVAKELIKQGADIVTDTNMALSGINKKVLARYGGCVHCFMAEEKTALLAKERQTTRAAVSMERAAKIPKPVIFAVGNAPTALIQLHKMIKNGTYRPAFIIGVPVGFVNVEAAKELILETEVPYIVNRGRKGGSNVAAAICNAILYELGR